MKQNRSLTVLLVALIAVFAVHLFYTRAEGVRADLTQTKLYSLTEGTHQILDRMNAEGVRPIEVKLYFSATSGKTLPQFIKNFITYEAYVRNLLREYARYSEGKIRLDFIDPKPDSDEAQDAADYGLDGKTINQHGDRFFFGLVFETQTGSKDVIDFLWPEKQDTIEYEISKKIYSLIWPEKQKIAVLSGLDVLPDNNPYMRQLMMAQGKQPSDPWIAMQLLQETYEVQRLDAETDFIDPEEFDLLLVIHPKGFGDKTLWAIDEWVVTGGKTMAFLDPYSIADEAPQNPQQPWAQLQYKPASDLAKLLNTWGLSRKDDTFAADFQLAYKGPIDRAGNMGQNVVDLVIDEKNLDQALNTDIPIFNGVQDLRFYFTGVLETGDRPEGVEFTPIMTTSGEGDELKIIPGFGEGSTLAYTDLGDPLKILDRYQPEGEKVLAYMVQGQFPSAYPEGASFPAETPQPPPGMPPGFQMPPPEDAEMIEKVAVEADRYAESRLLVFADVDFISDRVAFQNSFFGVQAVNDNSKVLINAVDYMLGSEELMNVRSKSRIDRPFTLFEDIEAQADESMLAQEQQIRNEIEAFREQVREKQRGLNQKDAVLFQKKLDDEVAALNERITEGERQLREIRKQKRALLEGEESFVRFTIMWLMPILVCILGVGNWYTNHRRKLMAKKG